MTYTPPGYFYYAQLIKPKDTTDFEHENQDEPNVFIKFKPIRISEPNHLTYVDFFGAEIRP